MKRIVVFIILIAMGGFYNPSNAQFWKKKKSKKSAKSAIVGALKNKKKDSYKDLIKDMKTLNGLFKIHHKENKVFFEIPNNLMGRDFLIASRVSAISNNKDVAAGQIPKEPIMIRFHKDKNNIYMHIVNTDNICDEDSEIYPSFQRNFLNPILKTFEIKSANSDSTANVIDVSDFFLSNVKEISPFREKNILDMIFGSSPLSGSFKKADSKIMKCKSFPENVLIRSRMAYNVKGDPFITEMTRTIILLPEEPMRPRIADNRIGYFTCRKNLYSEDIDKVKKIRYINRWRLEPKDADIEKYKNGELVEPQKPIVWYVDTAIPSKYRKYIMQGIEDWQEAFEEIGFKNAIIAKEYPKNDPNFDPDDIRYSCYKYITTKTANSMGPSWVDPRSGEIICGDVLFYSNVVKLLHDWRFVQTAQADPKSRAKKFSTEIMGASLRYVAAHEVGHTLGLMHNMAASHSIPVDSLRSPKFTQKYGTTASIMDYARYNYVAQPGDLERGVRLTPPDLGVYDKFAIHWGYMEIPEAEKPEDEYATLNKWILDKADDPMYYYGEQQFFFDQLDPKSLSEDLGDNSVEAGKYGVKNLKYIMKNLKSWTTEANKDYEYMEEMHSEVFSQFRRYIGHAQAYLGGFYLYNAVEGENKINAKLVSKKEQLLALDFIYDNIRDLPKWYIRKDVVDHIKPTDMKVGEYIRIISSSTISSTVIAHLIWDEKRNPNNEYSALEYMDDVFDRVFKLTKKGQNLNYYERLIQYSYIKQLLNDGGYYKTEGKSKKALSLFEEESLHPFEKVNHSQNELVQPGKESDIKANMNAVYFHELQKAKSLIKRNMNKGNLETRIHYRNLYEQLEKYM